jgi:hypothetical protein
MEKQVFEVGDSPRINIQTLGKLILKGTGLKEVVVRSDSREDLKFTADEEEVTIHSRSNLTVNAPQDSSIHIEKVHSEAVIKGFEGPLRIGEIKGSCVLKDTGQVEIDRILSDLVAKRIDGALSIRQVYGNVSVRRIEGDFLVEDAIRGNLALNDVEGDVKAEVYGNATLRLDPATGQSYAIKAKGNITCRLPGDSSVEVEIVKAANIKIDIKSTRIAETIRAPYSFTMGEGDAEMRLEANGNVVLAQSAPDWDMMDFQTGFDMEVEGAAEEISRQVTEQVEAQVEMIENQLEEQLSHLSATLGAAGLSQEAADRISQRAREASARATARTQEKMARVQEKLQRKWESAQRRIEQKTRAAEKRALAREGRSWGGAGWSHGTSKPPSDPVTEQERLLILQMLSEKKISLEEAEKLLEALEGK